MAVTFRPHVPDTAALLRAVAPQVDALVVVDNGSPAPVVAELRAACEEVGAELVELGANLGIAAAQNRGLARARELGAGLFLLWGGINVWRRCRRRKRRRHGNELSLSPQLLKKRDRSR